jgi:hypothetical protein
MAPKRWKVSDWKNARLDAYRLLGRGITNYRGDGTPIDRELHLGNLRDTYYEDAYGPLKPTSGEDKVDNVTRLLRDVLRRAGQKRGVARHLPFRSEASSTATRRADRRRERGAARSRGF